MTTAALLIATLLTADIHAGGAAGFSLGVPFRSANTGPVVVLKGLVDVGIGNKLTVGAVLPFTFGYYNNNFGFGSANWVFFWAEPFGLYARLDQSWSEYRFTLGAGYRW